MRRVLSCSCLIALLCSTAAQADIFPVPYTGQLSQAGTPVGGKHFFNFRIYNVVTGGVPVFTQAESLQVVGGVYSTFLNTPDTAWGDARWVGVAIDGAAELAPRVSVGAVPYAIRALHAARADTATVALSPPAAGLAQKLWGFSIALPASGITVVDTVKINCPAPGQILVTASGYMHVNGASQGGMLLGIGAPTGEWQVTANPGQNIPYGCTKSFPVAAAGVTTVLLYAQNTIAGNPVFIIPSTMNALYVPKAY